MNLISPPRVFKHSKDVVIPEWTRLVPKPYVWKYEVAGCYHMQSLFAGQSPQDMLLPSTGSTIGVVSLVQTQRELKWYFFDDLTRKESRVPFDPIKNVRDFGQEECFSFFKGLGLKKVQNCFKRVSKKDYVRTISMFSESGFNGCYLKLFVNASSKQEVCLWVKRSRQLHDVEWRVYDPAAKTMTCSKVDFNRHFLKRDLFSYLKDFCLWGIKVDPEKRSLEGVELLKLSSYSWFIETPIEKPLPLNRDRWAVTFIDSQMKNGQKLVIEGIKEGHRRIYLARLKKGKVSLAYLYSLKCKGKTKTVITSREKAEWVIKMIIAEMKKHKKEEGQVKDFWTTWARGLFNASAEALHEHRDLSVPLESKFVNA